MKIIADQLTDWLIENGLSENKREVYSYGLECLFNELIADLFLLLFALLLHKVSEMLIWSISFTVLRVNLGGLHASSHSKCIFFSTLLGIASVLICPIFINHLMIVFLFSIFSCLTAFFIAPVTHKNHPLSNQRKKYAHQLSIFISIFETILIIILYDFFPIISVAIFSGLISATLLSILGFIKK